VPLDCARDGYGAIRLPCQNLKATNKGASLDAPLFVHLNQTDYAQVITPLVISQVLADCECVAVALHEGGGPAAFVTTIVTFCDGVNP
jgi:hypothetical protein